MFKIILLTAAVGLAAAGVWDRKWTKGGWDTKWGSGDWATRDSDTEWRSRNWDTKLGSRNWDKKWATGDSDTEWRSGNWDSKWTTGDSDTKWASSKWDTKRRSDNWDTKWTTGDSDTKWGTGNWDTKWMKNERTNWNRQLTQNSGFDTIDIDPIKRMSSDELWKQRFLLKILDNVQQPWMEGDVCQVSDTFVMDQNAYRKEIDMDMTFVMELCRNRGQLKKGEFFNMGNTDHWRQMMGLQRILTFSMDWEIFKQNVCFARKEINEVLFVNALLQAVRQREDTRWLVIPGIYEILPEWFLDWDVIRAVRNIDLNSWSRTNVRDTKRQNFFETIGFGSRTNSFLNRKDDDLLKTNTWMPWRQFRMQMAMSKTPNNDRIITSDIEDKIVIPVQRRFDSARDMSLLTNDIGLNGFMNIMMNDLCLRESELKNTRIGRVNLYRDKRWTSFDRPIMTDSFDDIDRNSRWFKNDRMEENRFDGLQTPQWDSLNRRFDDTRRTKTVFDFPTTSIDNDRLLHINYRRLQSGRNNIWNDDFLTRNDRFRQQDVILRNRDRDEDQDTWQTFNENNDRKRFWMNSGDRWDTDRMTDNKFWGQQRQNMGDRYMTMLRGSQVYEGRHVKEERQKETFGDDRDHKNVRFDEQRRMMFNSKDDWKDDRMTWNRKTDDSTFTNMGRNWGNDKMDMDGQWKKWKDNDVSTTGVNDDRLLHINRRRLNSMDDDIRRVNFKNNDENINSRRWNDRQTFEDQRFNGMDWRTMKNINEDRRSMMGEWQDLEKIVPRSDVLLHNLKQIVARIENEKICLGIGNTMMSDNNMMMTQNDEISGGQMREVRDLIEGVFNNMNIGIDRTDPMTFDQIMANNLLNSNGKLNILDVFRDIGANDQQQDQRSAINMGVDLNNPRVEKVLKALCDTIDMQRTKVLGTYTRRDLQCDGVTVNNVDVDQFKTFTDLYDVDVRNLFVNRNDLSRDEQKMVVAKLQRLNHKDFTIKLDLDSDRNRQVMIRTFLGPKLSNQLGQELQFDESRQKFMLIDSNIVELQSGKNIIKRKSSDMQWTARDTTPLTQIYKRVMMALDNQMDTDNFTWTTKKVVGQDCRFPHRLILPRGSIEGMQMQMFVIVTDLENGSIERDDLTCAMGVGTRISDGRSFGFPLDRRVDNIEEIINLPNVKITDVIVRHEQKDFKDY